MSFAAPREMCWVYFFFQKGAHVRFFGTKNWLWSWADVDPKNPSLLGWATIHSGPFIPISVVWSTWPLHLEIIDTSSSYVLTSESVLSLFVANIDYITCAGNMGRSLQTKTSVFLSADAGLSWHQVRYRNTVKTELIKCRDLSVFSPESRIRIRFLRILIRIQSTVQSSWTGSRQPIS